jgi:hypothetical protein
MFRRCCNVLVTDLNWPTYEVAVEAEARRTSNRVTLLTLRDEILRRGWTADDVVLGIAEAFTANACDGLFLPAVDHLGIRLPIRRIVERVRERSDVRFCLVDGAQALCHVPLDDTLQVADFVVAGSHKWLGAYLPIGIGLFGKRESQKMLERRVRCARQSGAHSDPLLHLSEQLDNGELDGHSETANLTPLFACAGAVADRRCKPAEGELAPSEVAVARIPRPHSSWSPRRPVAELQSRIVLFESGQPDRRRKTVDAVRQSWLDAGCIVTAYPGGRVRVSLPD